MPIQTCTVGTFTVLFSIRTHSEEYIFIYQYTPLDVSPESILDFGTNNAQILWRACDWRCHSPPGGTKTSQPHPSFSSAFSAARTRSAFGHQGDSGYGLASYPLRAHEPVGASSGGPHLNQQRHHHPSGYRRQGDGRAQTNTAARAPTSGSYRVHHRRRQLRLPIYDATNNFPLRPHYHNDFSGRGRPYHFSREQRAFDSGTRSIPDTVEHRALTGYTGQYHNRHTIQRDTRRANSNLSTYTPGRTQNRNYRSQPLGRRRGSQQTWARGRYTPGFVRCECGHVQNFRRRRMGRSPLHVSYISQRETRGRGLNMRVYTRKILFFDLFSDDVLGVILGS